MIPGLINPNNKDLRQSPAPNPNFAIAVEDTETKPKGFVASILLDVLAVLSAGAVGYFLKGYLISGEAAWPLAVAAGVFGILEVLEALLSTTLARRVSILAGEMAALVSWFIPNYLYAPTFLLVLFGIGFAFLFWGEWQTQRILKNGMKLKFFEAVRPVVNKTLTCLVLIGVLIYLPQWEADGSMLSRQTFYGFYGSSVKVLNAFWRQTNFNGTVGDFLDGFARSQLNSEPAFKALQPAEQDAAISEIRAQILGQINKTGGVKLEESMNTKEAAYQYILSRLTAWRAAFGDNFLALWGLAAFFLVRGAAFLLYLLVTVVSFFMFEFLIALDVIKVFADSSVKETIGFN